MMRSLLSGLLLTIVIPGIGSSISCAEERAQPLMRVANRGARWTETDDSSEDPLPLPEENEAESDDDTDFDADSRQAAESGFADAPMIVPEKKIRRPLPSDRDRERRRQEKIQFQDDLIRHLEQLVNGFERAKDRAAQKNSQQPFAGGSSSQPTMTQQPYAPGATPMAPGMPAAQGQPPGANAPPNPNMPAPSQGIMPGQMPAPAPGQAPVAGGFPGPAPAQTPAAGGIQPPAAGMPGVTPQAPVVSPLPSGQPQAGPPVAGIPPAAMQPPAGGYPPQNQMPAGNPAGGYPSAPTMAGQGTTPPGFPATSPPATNGNSPGSPRQRPATGGPRLPNGANPQDGTGVPSGQSSGSRPLAGNPTGAPANQQQAAPGMPATADSTGGSTQPSPVETPPNFLPDDVPTARPGSLNPLSMSESDMLVEGPVDRISLADSLYSAGKYALAQKIYESFGDSPLAPDDKYWVQYQNASCLRRMAQTATSENDRSRHLVNAKRQYRILAGNEQAAWLKHAARWWLDTIQTRSELEQQLTDVQTRLTSTTRETVNVNTQ